jgi:hypothetical protein
MHLVQIPLRPTLRQHLQHRPFNLVTPIPKRPLLPPDGTQCGLHILFRGRHKNTAFADLGELGDDHEREDGLDGYSAGRVFLGEGAGEKVDVGFGGGVDGEEAHGDEAGACSSGARERIEARRGMSGDDGVEE